MSSYCTPTDLYTLALSQVSLAPDQTDDIVQSMLDTASDTVDSYLADQMKLPLTGTIPQSVKMKVLHIAAYWLLVKRGYNPVNPQHETTRLLYEDAIAWLERVADGKIRPPVTDSTPSGVNPAGPTILQENTLPNAQTQLPGPQKIVGRVVIGPPRLRGW